MKGATPAGPERRDQHERDPDERALRDRRQVREPRHQRQGYAAPAGTAFRSRRRWPATTPSVTALRRLAPGVDEPAEDVAGASRTSRRGRRPRPRRRRGTSPAAARCGAARSTAARAARARSRRSASQRSTASPTPWMPPQTTNVQAAPCQRPPSSIVSIRLRYVSRLRAAAAAERDVQVVAQPARQRHVPAPPEVLQRLGAVRARRSSAGSGSRAAARGRSRCRCSREKSQ